MDVTATQHDDGGLLERFPNRAKVWQLRTRTLALPRIPLLMGIVNVTPDSFSDGGRFFDSARAVDHALQLASEGADLVDIGGESTRPYSISVEESEEIRRVIPVIESVCRQTHVPVSIDTSKARVAQLAMDAGAEVINDVTGLESDSAMPRVALRTSAGVCAMHMQGTPQTMQNDPRYDNVVDEILSYLQRRRDALFDVGLTPERVCLDPGIGFGKTHEHNLTLMANCERFHVLGCPLLVGHSRKGFLGKLVADKNADRLLATVGSTLSLARHGVQVIRVHDVRAVREALIAFDATGGMNR